MNVTSDDNDAIRWAALRNSVAVVRRLLREPSVNPVAHRFGAIERPNALRRWEVIDVLLMDRRVDTMCDDMPRLSSIRAFRSRATEVCCALHDLGLPALLTLHIIDELIPNEVPMHVTWALVVKCKHFHKS